MGSVATRKYKDPLDRGVLCIFSSGHTAHKLISLHKTPLSRGSLYFLVATLPTNLYHYIIHIYQGGLYIFWWPHCPQTYITTYNTYITRYNTPIRGLCIFSGGHTAHKLISLLTILISLHTTPYQGAMY